MPLSLGYRTARRRERHPRPGQLRPCKLAALAEPDYKAITERNLFRAKLQVEIPKPKTEKEIEEEALTAIVKTMALKGVMLSPRKRDNYAVIDLGGQKGVWVYEPGDVIEKGLALKEIGKDSVRIEKEEFGVVLKLFSSAPTRRGGRRGRGKTGYRQGQSRERDKKTGIGHQNLEISSGTAEGG